MLGSCIRCWRRNLDEPDGQVDRDLGRWLDQADLVEVERADFNRGTYDRAIQYMDTLNLNSGINSSGWGRL